LKEHNNIIQTQEFVTKGHAVVTLEIVHIENKYLKYSKFINEYVIKANIVYKTE